MRIFKRKKADYGKRLKATDKGATRGSQAVAFVTWESELRAIAAEASAWSIETGGDLFGRWKGAATLYLATKAGPNAQRNNAHFRLDVEYLRQLSEIFATDWALRYFGDWHSHHRLGLAAPSSGDRRRIRGVGGRNQFADMIEIIVTLEDGRGEPTIRIHPWIYDLAGTDNEPVPLTVKVLPGLSPIRQALLGGRALSEQDLALWEKVPLHRIRIGSDDIPPVLQASSDVDAATREKTLSHLAAALQLASGETVEHHTTGFGCILVARLRGPYYLAFALGAVWPMPILEVHRLNRDDGSTEIVTAPESLAAPEVQGIVELFRSAKAAEEGKPHVDI
jgi:hypothetical protein